MVIGSVTKAIIGSIYFGAIFLTLFFQYVSDEPAIIQPTIFTSQPSGHPSHSPTSPTYRPTENPSPHPSKTPTKTPTYSSSPITNNQLPAIAKMSQVYNVLTGLPIYDQTGQDIISFQWNNRLTNKISDKHKPYEIPIELSSIPNLEISCSIVTTTHDVHYSTSSAILTEQSESSSFGFNIGLNLNLGLPDIPLI
eukprot:206274_1